MDSAQKDKESAVPLMTVPTDETNLKMQTQSYRIATTPRNDTDAESAVILKKDGPEPLVQLPQPQKFIGLTKEELQRYTEDPFWRNLRITLFVLFWLAWIIMLIAAIALVALSPPCTAKPLRHWWQKQLCYQLLTDKFQDSDNDFKGDIVGLTSRVEDLSYISVTAVWPTPLLHSDVKHAPINHSEIDSTFGTMEKFDELLKSVHKNGMYFIMDFEPSTISNLSPWFKEVDSTDNHPDSEKFYIRDDASGGNVKMWTKLANSEKYYRHLPDREGAVVLNFDKSKQYLSDALEFWLEQGVDGFHFRDIEYLAIEDGTDSPVAAGIPKIIAFFKDVTEDWKNKTDSLDKNILLFATLNSVILKPDDYMYLKEELVRTGGLNFVMNSDLLEACTTGVDCHSACTSACIHDKLNESMQFYSKANESSWPVWEIGSPFKSRVASRMGRREYAELMNLMLLTLPGSVKNYYGDELGMMDSSMDQGGLMQWSSDRLGGFTSAAGKTDLAVEVNDSDTINYKTQSQTANSALRLFRRIGNLRARDDAFLYGEMELGARNDSGLWFLRSQKSGLKYVTLLNFDDMVEGIVYNISQGIKTALPKKASVVAMTTNLHRRGTYRVRQEIEVSKIKLNPIEGILLKFKPE